ncbi:MAG TPA: methyltransferase domain-containing protein [Vicinamibacterales bacterium]|nr:methyltransferase domain-containing protein [Vicinamibacterales bacterium]
MPFFRRTEQKHAVAIAMTGVALGDRLLHLGCTDASLMGAIASKVGLSGRVCALVPDETHAARARRAAEKSGFLLEIETGSLTQFPFDAAAFNLIVVDNQDGILSSMRPELRVATLQEAIRTLSPRGRIVIIERGERGGIGALFGSPSSEPADPHYKSAGGAVAALEAEGFRAPRLLAERDGLSFFEGVR